MENKAVEASNASPAPYLNVVLLEDACLVQLYGAVESCLSAHGYHDPVGLLALDHVLHELGGYRQEEHLCRWGIHVQVQATVVGAEQVNTHQRTLEASQKRQLAVHYREN